MALKHDSDGIFKLRDWLQVSHQELADLLGVGVATVYRWKSNPESCKPDQFQNGMLEAIEFLVDFPDANKAKKRRTSIVSALRIGQPLRATWKLLDFYYRNAPLASEAA